MTHTKKITKCHYLIIISKLNRRRRENCKNKLWKLAKFKNHWSPIRDPQLIGATFLGSCCRMTTMDGFWTFIIPIKIIFFVDLEWMLSKSGCIKTTLKSDPRGTTVDSSTGFSILTRSSRQRKDSESDDDDDY